MSRKAESDIGTEVNGGSNGRWSMNNSMFTGEYDFPRRSSFHFHFLSPKFSWNSIWYWIEFLSASFVLELLCLVWLGRDSLLWLNESVFLRSWIWEYIKDPLLLERSILDCWGHWKNCNRLILFFVFNVGGRWRVDERLFVTRVGIVIVTVFFFHIHEQHIMLECYMPAQIINHVAEC